ncbi:MAG: helix-turn-helix domain-containing protein [Candidatus Krumholzibacteria bacterium]
MPRKGRFATTGEPFHPPMQARSRETHRRILEATSELLEKRTFDAVTVAEIARRSTSSVGAFYARFDDKDALLEQLDGLCAEEAASGPGAVGTSEHIQKRLNQAITFYVGLFRKRSGLIRALRVRERARVRTRFGEALRSSMRGLLVDPVLLERRHVGHADPQLAATLGSLMVMSAIEERVLYPEMTTSPTPITDAMFVTELTRAYVAYLGVS